MNMAEPTGPKDCIFGHGALDEVLAPLTDTHFGAPGTFAIARCPHCGQLQTVPRPDPAMIEALNATYASGKSAVAVQRQGRGRFAAGWPARIWRAIDGDIDFYGVKGSGRLLEIGCGNGGGLNQFQRNGFEAVGLKVAAEPLADFSPDAPFDVAVLVGELERAMDPRAMLGHVNRILKTGGEVWISLANADSALRPLFGGDWINWHVPYHLTHFNGPGLRRLLAEAGFEVFSFHNATPASWLARSVIARIYARPGEPTSRLGKAWLVGAWAVVLKLFLFPTLWMLNNAGRGDALIVRARKL
jgi:SAM-dependent methyltransferase